MPEFLLITACLLLFLLRGLDEGMKKAPDLFRVPSGDDLPRGLWAADEPCFACADSGEAAVPCALASHAAQVGELVEQVPLL